MLKNKMKKFSGLIIFIFLLFSCYSPKEALKRGYYKTAMRNAADEIKRGKNIEENKFIVHKAADQLVKKIRYKNKELENSDDIKTLIKIQDKYYVLLENIGKANLKSNGEITDIYDNLCSVKQDIDYKIANIYFQRANKFLSEYNQNHKKETSRNAYFNLASCKKSGGLLYFNGLDSLMEFSYKKGIVYYVSDDVDIGYSLFLQPLPDTANFEPDCIVDVDYGWVNIDKSESIEEKKYEKEIQTGTKEVKDTAGNITYIPVYETIKATVYTKTITWTASRRVNISVDDNTGECTLNGESFIVESSDSFEEIEIEGDERAINTVIIEKRGKPAFFESDLEDELNNKIRQRLNSF